MLPLNKTLDYISNAFFENCKYALEFLEIFSKKLFSSSTASKKKNFMVIIMNSGFRYKKFIYLHCGEETKLRDPRS